MKIHAYIFEMFRACHFGEIFHQNILLNDNDNDNVNKYKYLVLDWVDAWDHSLKMAQIKHYPPATSTTTSVEHSGWNTPTKLLYEGVVVPSIQINNNNDQDTSSELVYQHYDIINNTLSTTTSNNIPSVAKVAHYPRHEHIHSFLNFLFCPSLVYRWSYPTLVTKKKNLAQNDNNFNDSNNDEQFYKINWSNIFFQIINMMACLLFVFVVFYRHICPSYENTPYQTFKVSDFLSSIFSSAIPGMLLVIMCFFGVVHCWLNMWSELMGYSDRIFYEDWWASNTFAAYSKKWNLVVYNWSYNYFFLPMLEAGYSKSTADLFTFLLWAAVQEYVFTAVSQCFYPVLLVSCIVFGLLFYSVPFMDSSLKYYDNENSKDDENGGIVSEEFNTGPGGVCNVVLWIMLFLQNGFFVTLYAREWYAHRAFVDGKITLDDQSYLPYSWQTAFYPNGTKV